MAESKKADAQSSQMVSDSRSDPDRADHHSSYAAEEEEVDIQTTLEKLEAQLQKQELLNSHFASKIFVNSHQINTSIQEFQNSLQLIFQELEELKQAQPQRNVEEIPVVSDRQIPSSHNLNSAAGILGSAPKQGNGTTSPHLSNELPILHNSQSSLHSSSSFLHHKQIKLEFPKFDGTTDVLAWIKKIELVFRYHNVPKSEKVQIFSFHLRSEALQLFFWLAINVDNYFE